MGPRRRSNDTACGMRCASASETDTPLHCRRSQFFWLIQFGCQRETEIGRNLSTSLVHRPAWQIQALHMYTLYSYVYIITQYSLLHGTHARRARTAGIPGCRPPSACCAIAENNDFIFERWGKKAKYTMSDQIKSILTQLPNTPYTHKHTYTAKRVHDACVRSVCVAWNCKKCIAAMQSLTTIRWPSDRMLCERAPQNCMHNWIRMRSILHLYHLYGHIGLGCVHSDSHCAFNRTIFIDFY